MRRFRNRRRRALALALPVAALFTTATFTSAAEQRYAKIEPAKDSVRIGERVRLHGRFPDAPNATIQIRHRRKGSDRFLHIKDAQTDAEGRFAVRVKPRAIGVWRAQLTYPQRYASSPTGLTGERNEVDTRTGAKRVGVR